MGARKLEGMVKKGDSLRREMRKEKGMKEQQGEKGRGHTVLQRSSLFYPYGLTTGHSRMETDTSMVRRPSSLSQDMKQS